MKQLLVFATIILFPSVLAKLDDRGVSQRKFVIRVEGLSPAVAAFQDIKKISNRFAQINWSEGKWIPLHSGNAAHFEKYFYKEAPAKHVEPGLRLSRLTIKAPHVERTTVAQLDEVKPMPLNFEPALYNKQGDLLPLEDRKKKILDFYAAQPIEPDVSLSQRAKPLIEESLAKNKKSLRPLSISGQLQMADGLAFMGPSTEIRLNHTVRGKLLGHGYVNVAEGRFDIAVQSQEGYLEAELYNEKHQVIGRADYDLSLLPALSAHHIKSSGILLKLKPVSERPTVSLVSAYSFDSHKMPIEKPEVAIDQMKLSKNEDGEFTADQFHPASMFVTHAVAKNYWGSLAVGLGNSPTEIELFPKKMVSALLNLTLGDVDQKKSIVWGRVIDHRGRPLSGATVELAGDSQSKIVYFNNNFLPDTQFHQTSATGWYAFVNVAPGTHSIRARYDGQFIPSQTLPAEPGFVSYALLQMSQPKTAAVLVQDAFDPNVQLESALHVLGADIDLDISGQGQLRYPSGNNTMLIEVNAGEEFETSRFTTSRQVKDLKFPMIKKDWISGLTGQMRLSVDPVLSRMAGFVASSDFVVELERDGRPLQSNIVYFNSQGHQSVGRVGEAGGGFLILNVEPGPVNLIVRLTNSNQTFYQTRYVDSDFLDVALVP